MKNSAKQPHDISVENRLIMTKSETGNGPGGIGSDAGEFAQLLDGIRESAIHFGGHNLSGTVEVSSAQVIAQPLPDLEDGLNPGPGKILNRRKPFQKFRVIG